MKTNKFFEDPKVWWVLSFLYLIFLFYVIIAYDPDLLNIKNCLLLIPLYIAQVIAINLQGLDEYEDRSNE